MHAQSGMSAVDKLHEAGVDPLRESRMALQFLADRRHRSGVDIGHLDHRMRIAHAHRAAGQGGAVGQGQAVFGGSSAGMDNHRDLGRLEARRAHVDPHLAVIEQMQLQQAGGGLHPQVALVAEAMVAHIARQAARTVAALADFGAVGVENAVAEVHLRARRGLDQQHLVAAHAETAVGELTQQGGRGRPQQLVQRRPRGVDDDEVVAEAVHLGEGQIHGRRLSA